MEEIAPEFDAQFLSLLSELNTLVASIGEPVEGSCFYGPCFFPPAQIHPGMRTRRSSLLAAARNKKNILEIGVNAGHSALLMLYHHPHLAYHGVDICHHRYTPYAVDFLTRHFGKRIAFHPGDSRRILPMLAHANMHFDLMHIDGSHDIAVFEDDFRNCIALGNNPAWIVVDDTKAWNGIIGNHLRQLVEEGLAQYDPCVGWNSPGSELVKIIRR